MPAQAKVFSAQETLPLRVRYREEMNCQIVHDSIHRRPGWTTTYRLEQNGVTAGYGSLAIGGPWTSKPTLFEFYVLPAYRQCAFDLFEALLAESRPVQMEIQSNDSLLAVMFHTYATDIASEKIVFRDHNTTALPANGASLRPVTPDDEVRRHIEARQDGFECLLEIEGQVAGKGGILFHYNRPYGDIYMEITESHRRRGLGAWLVQELKRLAYDLGAIPCARCSPTNIPSRRTLQKAGLIPFAHMLTGTLTSPH